LQVNYGLKVLTEDVAACCRLQAPEDTRMGRIQRAPKSQWMDKGDITLALTAYGFLFKI